MTYLEVKISNANNNAVGRKTFLFQGKGWLYRVWMTEFRYVTMSYPTFFPAVLKIGFPLKIVRAKASILTSSMIYDLVSNVDDWKEKLNKGVNFSKIPLSKVNWGLLKSWYALLCLFHYLCSIMFNL